MKINYVGFVAGMVAFASLALAWWAMDMSTLSNAATVWVNPYSVNVSVGERIYSLGLIESVLMNRWFGWSGLVLIVVAGVMAFVGSFIVGRRGRIILGVAGILALLSITIFAVGMQSELSNASPNVGFPLDTFPGLQPTLASYSYIYYYAEGFWLALIAAAVAFVSVMTHPKDAAESKGTTNPID